MKFKHISEEQPIHGHVIIQIDKPYEFYGGDFKNHYPMGMREYYQNCSYDDVLECCRIHNINYPDFWWIYAKDFTFPDYKGN